jgi:hypothetical protein
MKQSESIANLAAAMAAAQGEMGAAVKGSSNPFFKSKYASLGDVIEAVKAPFAAHGLSYVQFPVSGEGSVGLATRLMHSSGEWLEQSFFIPLSRRWMPRLSGSCYVVRKTVSLCKSIAGIPSEDDDGNAASVKQPHPSHPSRQKPDTEFGF